MLGSNYSNGSIVSVDTDVVGVMAAYLPMVHVCNIFKYFIIILIVFMNYIFVHLLDNKVFLIVTDARYKHEDSHKNVTTLLNLRLK